MGCSPEAFIERAHGPADAFRSGRPSCGLEIALLLPAFYGCYEWWLLQKVQHQP